MCRSELCFVFFKGVKRTEEQEFAMIKKANVGRIALVWVGLCAIAASALAQAGPALTLVRDGKPAAVIVVGQKASTTEQYAAEELQLYL